jgi:hypothetical protein
VRPPPPADAATPFTPREVTDMKARLVALIAAPVALAVPASAGAAGIAVSSACPVSGAKVALSGSGFTPGATVRFGDDVSGRTVADAAGNIAASFTAAHVTTVSPRAFRVTATDGANPAIAAAAQFRVIRDSLLTNAPLGGAPRGKTTWVFVGFPARTAIYGHYRFRGRTVKNYRFGTPTGPCGTLTVRARRVPVSPALLHSGTWTLQLDQRRQFRTTGPKRVIPFRVFRTPL